MHTVTVRQVRGDGVGVEVNAERDGARGAYADGLSAYAAAIGADPHVPLPHGEPLLFAHSRAEFLAAAALLDADATPTLDPSSNYQFQLRGRIRGLRVTVYADPEDACEKGASRMVEQHEWSYAGAPVAVKP